MYIEAKLLKSEATIVAPVIATQLPKGLKSGTATAVVAVAAPTPLHTHTNPTQNPLFKIVSEHSGMTFQLL